MARVTHSSGRTCLRQEIEAANVPLSPLLPGSKRNFPPVRAGVAVLDDVLFVAFPSQQRLYLRPLPQGQGSFRPTFVDFIENAPIAHEVCSLRFTR
jgi:hypothetical protein